MMCWLAAHLIEIGGIPPCRLASSIAAPNVLTLPVVALHNCTHSPSFVPEKLGDLGTTAKEKASEAKAKGGEMLGKGKAETQESVDKAQHPFSHSAHEAADAKEAATKTSAEMGKEQKVAGAQMGAAGEKEARHLKHQTGL
ncbi:unnamed protein product [Closterium sp. NIES-53]